MKMGPPRQPNAEQPGSGTLVAVCTFNEIDSLPELVERVFAVLPAANLLIVDDDSPDGTGRWAVQRATEDQRLRVIVRSGERGLGGALKRAFSFAVDQRYQFLMNLDGDLSHRPEHLPGMLAKLLADPILDVVIGSRYCPGGSVRGWPWHRRLMSRMVNRFATRTLNLPVSDCSGSLRCYRVDSLAAIDPRSLQADGYAILEEVLLRLHKNNSKMLEMPIEFHDRQQGSSKLTFGEAWRAAKHLIRIAAHR